MKGVVRTYTHSFEQVNGLNTHLDRLALLTPKLQANSYGSDQVKCVIAKVYKVSMGNANGKIVCEIDRRFLNRVIYSDVHSPFALR